jgi:hypothetical protein
MTLVRVLAIAVLAVHQWKITEAVAAQVDTSLSWRDLCMLALVWAVFALGLPILVIRAAHRLKRFAAWWAASS